VQNKIKQMLRHNEVRNSKKNKKQKIKNIRLNYKNSQLTKTNNQHKQNRVRQFLVSKRQKQTLLKHKLIMMPQ